MVIRAKGYGTLVISKRLPAIAIAVGGALAATAATAENAHPTSQTFDCIIEPSAHVELASESPGVIDRILVKRGQRVSRDEPVAQLRSSKEAASLAIAKHRARDKSDLAVKLAKETFESRRLRRHRGLIGARVLPEQEADEIRTAQRVAKLERKSEEANLAGAKFELQRAEALLKSTQINSTVDGVVLSINKEPGEHVDGEAVVTIVRLDPLHVEVFTPINIAMTLKVGGAAVVKSPYHPPLDATIDVINGVADAASRTVKIRLVMANNDGAVIAGQNCKASFRTK